MSAAATVSLLPAQEDATAQILAQLLIQAQLYLVGTVVGPAVVAAVAQLAVAVEQADPAGPGQLVVELALGTILGVVIGLFLVAFPLGKAGQTQGAAVAEGGAGPAQQDRKSTRLNSSHVAISY